MGDGRCCDNLVPIGEGDPMKRWNSRSLVCSPARTGAVLAAFVLLGCSSDEPPAHQPKDLSEPWVAPQPCELRRVDPACMTPNRGATGQAGAGGEAMGEGGSAGLAGAGGESGLPTEDPCFVRSEAILSCPSRVGALYAARGSYGELDLLVAQQGLDGRSEQGQYLRNQLAYDEAHRLPALGASDRRESVLEPFVAGGDDVEKTLAVVPGGDSFDTLWTEFMISGPDAGLLRVRELFQHDAPLAQVPLDSVAMLRAQGLVAGDEGILIDSDPFGSFSMVRGLPDAPNLLMLGDGPNALAVAAKRNGDLRLLIHDLQQVTGLGGDGLEQVIYSLPGDTGTSMPSTDIAFAGTALQEQEVAMFRNGGNDPYQVIFVNANGEPSPPGFIHASARSNCGALTLGLTCDDCPVGEHCEVREERIGQARLFFEEQRVFVAYVATEIVETRVAERHTVPLLEIGCSCSTDRVSSEAAERSLVVLEVLPPEPAMPPKIVPQQRLLLGSETQLDHVVMERSRDGWLDVVVGPQLGRFADGQGEFPSGPREYRIIQLGGGGD